jgi:hypothetical protein
MSTNLCRCCLFRSLLSVGDLYLKTVLQEALWRTNHGYDPVFLQTVVGSGKPGGDSFLRYMLIHDTILQYQQSSTLIGDAEALNITAVRECFRRVFLVFCYDSPLMVMPP